ncbi:MULTISPECIES: ABC transporter permease [Dictyoglomus]|jgi:peptide/nickel transport system permease protein|uniref:Binding-protein-dependent transport systems inner membrane component n=1 Tax=Dictyoglomus turgidum (strain DSM 6724 / Z-1310) TaxID=515635 RepID=B8E057_DICTD|nr:MULTISPECIES: ABC transporter permease [Dictyoglomus]ACK42140.1 binding-protein-dependent transport systems inner membrane component [Dictyoglomus turgidum DSM 6724]PNV80180.1 MAG: ABC transporter permease [Dictyoglomus turgidum]HBU32371.1 ABC transporter permease [Dictyoglomus sp.]
MREYIIKRLLLLIPIVIGVSFFSFILIRLIPGDPARIILGERATPQELERIREELGLNKPILVQYLIFLKQIAKGDLGRSIITREKVIKEIMNRFPATIELTFFSMFIAVFFGIFFGILASLKPGSFIDSFVMFLALIGVSMPIFWLGLMLIWFGSLYLGWFPPSGRLDVDINLNVITNFYLVDSILTGNFKAFFNSLYHLILPSIALSSVPMATIARMTRSSMLEVLNQEYILAEYAKGLPKRKIILRSALRNALIPIITVIGLEFGFLLGGAIMTETIFSWPGMGRLVYDAIMSRDYPLIQGAILLSAFLFVMINLVVDVIYVFIDPRIRY